MWLSGHCTKAISNFFFPSVCLHCCECVDLTGPFCLECASLLVPMQCAEERVAYVFAKVGPGASLTKALRSPLWQHLFPGVAGYCAKRLFSLHWPMPRCVVPAYASCDLELARHVSKMLGVPIVRRRRFWCVQKLQSPFLCVGLKAPSQDLPLFLHSGCYQLYLC